MILLSYHTISQLHDPVLQLTNPIIAGLSPFVYRKAAVFAKCLKRIHKVNISSGGGFRLPRIFRGRFFAYHVSSGGFPRPQTICGKRKESPSGGVSPGDAESPRHPKKGRGAFHAPSKGEAGGQESTSISAPQYSPSPFPASPCTSLPLPVPRQ